MGVTYAEAVEQAGGVPVVLAPVGVGADRSAARAAGRPVHLRRPGPRSSFYGADPHPELGPTFPDIDRFELAILRHAQALGLPVLAICRGMQLLNVSRGGTLCQHLPDGSTGRSRIARRGRDASRPTRFASSAPAAWARCSAASELDVNSFHHQAVQRVGTGLHAVAWSPDGVIEAVETDAQHFAVGVQWHAESLVHDTPHATLFAALVRAAAAPRRRAGRPPDVRSLGT